MVVRHAASVSTREGAVSRSRVTRARLDGAPLNAVSLAAYFGHLHDTGRAPAQAAKRAAPPPPAPPTPAAELAQTLRKNVLPPAGTPRWR